MGNRWTWVADLWACAACAQGGPGDGVAPRGDGGAVNGDAAAHAPGTPGSASDAGHPASSNGGDDGGGDSGLDPLLVRPDPSGAPCPDPGSQTECADGEVCRIDGTSSGRCQGCTGSVCGQPGDPCASSADCDTLAQCYGGHCRDLCPRGSPDGICPSGATCVNVGNGSTGVCSK